MASASAPCKSPEDGRSLTSAQLPDPVYGIDSSSYVEMLIDCGGFANDTEFDLGGPRYSPVAIDAAGRFSTIAHLSTFSRPDTGWARLRGSFIDSQRAVVRIVAGRYHSGRHTCQLPHSLFHFRLRPLPPYPDCATAPGRTLAQSADARIYTNWGRDEEGSAAYAYGCLFGGGRIVLGRGDGSDDAPDFGNRTLFKLAGPFVSYEILSGDEYILDELAVVDLRGSASTLYHIANSIPGKFDETFSDYFAKTVLTPLGSVAWIGSYDCQDQDHCYRHTHYEVWIRDASGQRRVDRGLQIAPKSLQLRDTGIVWRNAGVEKSAPIDAGSG
jgi:hypothetical protein